MLDHHKTSAAELTDPAVLSISNLEVHFDMERSGATVALDYFQPEVGRAGRAPSRKEASSLAVGRWRCLSGCLQQKLLPD